MKVKERCYRASQSLCSHVSLPPCFQRFNNCMFEYCQETFVRMPVSVVRPNTLVFLSLLPNELLKHKFCNLSLKELIYIAAKEVICFFL